jgi:hypothetical protein
MEGCKELISMNPQKSPKEAKDGKKAMSFFNVCFWNCGAWVR